MRRTRLLPGNTYSDMLGHRPRSAESKATLTLGDYRSFLTEEVDRYHNRVHRTLGATPKTAWERAWKRSRGVESPSVPNSRERFLMDFLPVRTRVITREGIEIDGLRFSHESLQGEINPTVKRVVRVDPRDISRVYLETPDSPYLSIPLRANHTMPKMSWWEWKAIRRQRNGRSATYPLEPVHTTALRAGRARARKVEWRALQAIQALPAPDTRLRPVVRSDMDSPLPQWEILD
jgi:putative transposase